MRAFVFSCLLALSAPVLAHPLQWLEGNYHSLEGASHLEESWVVCGQSEALGTTTWLQEGKLYLRELMRIERISDQDYQLDLWLTFSAGNGRHLVLRGKAPGPNGLHFEAPGETLTYSKDARGHLVIELKKGEAIHFDLSPGVAPAPASAGGDGH